MDEIHNDFLGLLFGSTLIALVGVWDDSVMGMRPRSKFAGANLGRRRLDDLRFFVIPGFEVPFTHVYVNIPLLVSVPLTLLWYLGMMNAINFLDGLDGLLSGVTAISGAFLVVIALGYGHAVAALVLCALVGAALGFLPYNFYPAKIILGDTGSLFIGYVFATVSIIITAKVAVTVSLLIPLGGAGVAGGRYGRPRSFGARAPVKSVTEGDRRHFHHHLGLRSRPERCVKPVLLIYAVCFRARRSSHTRSREASHASAFESCRYMVKLVLRVMTVFGTRPDTIKMAPLVHALAAMRPPLSRSSA